MPPMVEFTPSKRVASLKPSVTIALTNRAKDLLAQGVDVLGFAAGEPDFDTPERIKTAAINALRAGQTKYAPTFGDLETRGVVATKLEQENGIHGLSAEHIAISAGGKHSLFVAMQVLLDEEHARGENDAYEVIIPTPAWVSYRPLAELAGGEVVEIETTPESGFRMTPEQLEAAITPRSRILMLNSPSNPCGTMYTEQQLRELADVVADKATVAPNLLIITDEIYEKIVYGKDEQGESLRHFSIGSVPSVAERTITVNGLSKAFAMTGWRVGYAGMPGTNGKRFIKAMAAMQGQMTTNITSFVYPAIRTALTECATEVEEMRLAFAARAELITGLLREIPYVELAPPTGAFYAFPDISQLFGMTTPGGVVLGSALDLSEALLNEAKIAFVPGEDFGGVGQNHVRISFACSEEQIEKGMQRFAEFVDSLD